MKIILTHTQEQSYCKSRGQSICQKFYIMLYTTPCFKAIKSPDIKRHLSLERM